MSWQAYITNLESGNGKCKYAVLAGKEGGVWAESSNKDFCLSATEIAKLVSVITNPSDSVYSEGLLLNNIKFTCLRLEPEVLVAQGKADKKDYSLVAALSGKAIIIGFNPDADVKTANVRDGVEGIKDYLKSAGY